MPKWNEHRKAQAGAGASAKLEPAGSSATDSTIQTASDMIAGRDPDEPTETRDYYGPGVRPRPINMQNYITKLRSRKP